MSVTATYLSSIARFDSAHLAWMLERERDRMWAAIDEHGSNSQAHRDVQPYVYTLCNELNNRGLVEVERNVWRRAY